VVRIVGGRGGGTAFPVCLSDGVGKHYRKTMDTHEEIPEFIFLVARSLAQKVKSGQFSFFLRVGVCRSLSKRLACRVKTAFRGDISSQRRPEATEPRVWFSFTVWVCPAVRRGEEGSGGREEEEEEEEDEEGEEEELEEALTVPWTLSSLEFSLPPKAAQFFQPPARIARGVSLLCLLESPLLGGERLQKKKGDSVREENMHPGQT
jgi:hypothetical protein